MSSIFALQLVLTIFLAQKTLPQKSKTLLCVILLLTSVSAMGYAERTFYKGHKKIRRYFSKHKLYKWDLPGTGFISTMNPDYFADSVQLIEKYKNGKGIYMLSQYDNFLPFLARTYNKLPLIDVQWYLTTCFSGCWSLSMLKIFQVTIPTLLY